jgi:5-methylcytosine-specific restriction enzyme A
MEAGKRCALCERDVSTTSRHHLTPKQKGGKHGPTVPLCQPCHTTLHLTFSNKELATTFNSIPALQVSDRLQPYLEWIRPRKLERIQNRRKKR